MFRKNFVKSDLNSKYNADEMFVGGQRNLEKISCKSIYDLSFAGDYLSGVSS